MIDFFVEVASFQAGKHGQPLSGDVFLSRKIKEEKRIVNVLADGLGSGVKANVLATLTSTMAVRFISSDTDLANAAAMMMDILPVCKERKIGYSTFTVVDVAANGQTTVIEHDNPAFLLIGNRQTCNLHETEITVGPAQGTTDPRTVKVSRFKAGYGDRIIFFSDGVNQSGMGQPRMPLGWGLDSVRQFAEHKIATNPQISARDLARDLVQKAVKNDSAKPKDDITCGVVYFRRPRQLLMVTGPPYARENDSVMASQVADFPGKVLICGGTTASIVARELNRQVAVDLNDLHPCVPPTSRMQGIELVTEGTITLAKVAEMLEQSSLVTEETPNGATRLVQQLIDSDRIRMLVGTRINEAHQDPNVPVELDIRRNIMKKIMRLLEEKYLKEMQLEFI